MSEENKNQPKKQQVETFEGMKSIEDFWALDEPDVLIDFECVACGCIDPIPEFILDEFSYDLPKGEEAETVCPECNGTMRRKKGKAEG